MICSSIGVTGLVAKVATGPTADRTYSTVLLGRLVSKHRAGQDLVRNIGALDLLINQTKVQRATLNRKHGQAAYVSRQMIDRRTCRQNHQTRLQLQESRP